VVAVWILYHDRGCFFYLWRFHISHTAPSSVEEYETAIAKADFEVSEYLKKKGDNVDENTVTLLTGAADIEAGKAIFTNPPIVLPVIVQMVGVLWVRT
jgi:hypothetical protein